MTRLYKSQARHALVTIQEALRDAVSGLPAAVRRQHWMEAKHSPAAWESVAQWYYEQPEYTVAVRDILLDITLLQSAAASLHSIVIAPDPGKHSLALATVRRTS